MDRDREYGRRDFMDRAGDEIRSWFGDDEAERRRRMDEPREPRERFERDRWERDRWTSPRDRDDRDRYEDDRSRMRVRDNPVHAWMSRSVATVHPSDPVEHAARRMAHHDVGALPVAQGNGRLIGMITDRDLVVRLLARGRDPLRCRVEDAMTEDVYPVRMDEDLDRALDVMARHRVRRVPVVDDRDRIVGMLSQADVARHARTRGLPARDVTETISEISEPGRR
ncbi:MAG TPA: CBS domain-containing protein [Candidatus Polarisedimenticolaceae bacterium]|nr:CBS domain-containing protein [Candidatus Polarisedimenticolaceae bacterium]